MRHVAESMVEEATLAWLGVGIMGKLRRGLFAEFPIGGSGRFQGAQNGTDGSPCFNGSGAGDADGQQFLALLGVA